MPFNAKEMHDLPKVISAPRFATYLKAASNNRERALSLYHWNLNLSAAFIVPLQVCEVAVRNGIVEAIEKVHGPNWPWTDGFLRSLPKPKKPNGYKPEANLREVACRQPTAGKVVADLNLAFWEKILTVGQDDRLWLPHFRTSFPGAPASRSIPECRAAVHSKLRDVRELRNRIAHHEPIFSRNIVDEYNRLHELIEWRNPVAASWMDSVQGVIALISSKP